MNTSTNFVRGFVSAHFNQPSYFYWHKNPFRDSLFIQHVSPYWNRAWWIPQMVEVQSQWALVFDIHRVHNNSCDRQEFCISEFILGKEYWKTFCKKMAEYNIHSQILQFFFAITNTGHTTATDSFHCCGASSSFAIKFRKTLFLSTNIKLKNVARLKMYLLLLRVKTIKGYLPNSTHLSKPCGFLALEANSVLITQQPLMWWKVARRG